MGSGYSRGLLPAEPMLPAEAEAWAGMREEARRRRDGPLCAICAFSPLDESYLDPLTPADTPKVAKVDRRFVCEARGRECTATSGHGCRFFEKVQPPRGAA